jgi:hypothetical protein
MGKTKRQRPKKEKIFIDFEETNDLPTGPSAEFAKPVGFVGNSKTDFLQKRFEERQKNPRGFTLNDDNQKNNKMSFVKEPGAADTDEVWQRGSALQSSVSEKQKLKINYSNESSNWRTTSVVKSVSVSEKTKYSNESSNWRSETKTNEKTKVYKPPSQRDKITTSTSGSWR